MVDEINSKVDNLNLLEPIGSMMHAKSGEIAYRKIDVYKYMGKKYKITL